MLSPGTSAVPPVGAVSRCARTSQARRESGASRCPRGEALSAQPPNRITGLIRAASSDQLFAPGNSFGERSGENPCEGLSGTFPRPWAGNGAGRGGGGEGPVWLGGEVNCLLINKSVKQSKKKKLNI